MMSGEDQEIEEQKSELLRVLERDAIRQVELRDNSQAFLIRQQIREIVPGDINNLLHLIQLAIKIEKLTREEISAWRVIELLTAAPPGSIKSGLLLQVLEKWLGFASLHPLALEFAEVCLQHLQQNYLFCDVLMWAALKVTHSMNKPGLAISLAELCLRGNPKYPEEVWGHLADFYYRSGRYGQGIEAAKQCYSISESLVDKVFANHKLLKGLLYSGGHWQEAIPVLERQDSLLLSLIEQPPKTLGRVEASRLLMSNFFFPCFRDCPQKDRKIQNKVASLCQSYIRADARDQQAEVREKIAICQGRLEEKRKIKRRGARPLKVGYLSHCLRSHSVGWLARWLFEYHDRSLFEIHGYFINYHPLNDPLQNWYIDRVGEAHKLESDSCEIAARIASDEINILIDLDSLTLDTTFEVMALKPAPIQATWLGWDASGLPAVDYFIADRYVLPDSAEDYYAEKIWRLPQTFIAVDGFEVGVPTLQREDLEIPSDAIVYFSGQRGYKRHPETARLQMKIIKAVPNSYFLLKNRADEETVKSFFTQLAEAEGVSSSRLRFLPPDPSEAIHRANLAIADVVLDTYPYNGATTTMETLWMGIPLVTRVGEQFCSRNSYSMMANAGVTEGIARTDEEYVEWGVCLGLDAKLRQEISWKLRRNRETAPLWNAKQFTREMEKAYEQMYEQMQSGYLHSSQS